MSRPQCVKVSTKSVSLVGAKPVRSDIRLAFQANVATLGSTLVGSPPGTRPTNDISIEFEIRPIF